MRARNLVTRGLLTLGALAGLPGRAATVVVPTDYQSIQAAIDAAVSGDTVLIEPGNYIENLILRSGIDVAGREAARTTIEPSDDLLAIVTIASVTDVRLSNLTLTNASTAITTSSSTDIVISNSVFDGATDVAIAIDSTSFVDVTNNVFFANANAIQRSSPNVDVINNIFRDNDVTVSSPFGLIDNDSNVDANCWSNNADLLAGGSDGSYGTNAVTGDPQFADTAAGDFHLQQGSPCIDIGVGNDIIDDTVADAGAYGGELADAVPYPVAQPTLTSADPMTSDIEVDWPPNLGYLITNTASPGGYRVYYRQNASGPPYDGTDADGGLAPSPIDVGATTTYTLSNLSPVAPGLDAPTLLAADGANTAVVLTWTAVPNADSYRIHYGETSTDENQTDVGNVTKFTVAGLTNGVTYRFAVGALAQATYHVAVTAVDNTVDENESALSQESSLAIGPTAESAKSNELTAFPEFILPYPALRDEGGCFIATAAFGADWTDEVQLLRRFRDEYLLTNTPGRAFVELYYRLSPPVADAIRDRPAVRAIVRLLLMPLVAFAWFLLDVTMSFKLVTVALIAGVTGWRMLRRKRVRMAPLSNEG
jgi:hypothetical protein